ncbi:MAG: glycosyltransferase family 4 protein [Candidatus Hydrogenedentes bacterium]|nr:glycosyltransferase family 4 protein [Candidatus Hydrogenedentota bacterium]
MVRPADSSIQVALDVSCAAESPITGIGYAAIYQLRALFAREDPDFHFALFAAGGRGGAAILDRELPGRPARFIPYARLAKYYAWNNLNWPPIEWFTGPARIAHNFSHQVPATSRAIKVVTVHDLSMFRHPGTHTARAVEVQQTLLRSTAKRAGHIVAVSESCKSELIDVLHVPADRIHVIHNGVNTAEFDAPFDARRVNELRQTHNIQGDYIIHLGTLEPRKNLVRLCEAYKQLLGRRDELPKLVIVGAVGWGADPILEAIASLGDAVVRPGYLSRADAILLLRGARACVYPSIYEGFGLPVLEAMAARTPVITSNVSALPEVAGEAALYIDPVNSDSIAHAIEQVLDDPAAAAARVATGRARAESFSWETSAAKLADLYRDLAN